MENEINEVIVNIDTSYIESKLSDIFTLMSDNQQKLIELQEKFIQFHEFSIIALGFLAGLFVGYIFVKVAFSGD